MNTLYDTSSNLAATTASEPIISSIPAISFLRREYCASALAGRISMWMLILLSVAYVLPGITGYGPWKPDEPYMFGLIHSLIESGDWVVPKLAGEPFMEKPPLMVWSAALTATLSSPWLLPEHGARLAIGLFMLITLTSLGATARRWWGPGSGRYAVIALLGSLGLLQHGHMMIPDIPLLAGVAVAFHGWAWIQERPLKGGALFGTGVGMALMAKGLLGPGMLGVTAILLPMVFRSWRTPGYRRGLLVALAASLPWLLVWPLALYTRSPELFMEWFWFNNVGRFLGFSVPVLGASHEYAHLLKTVPWFTFPLLPLALWAIWKLRQQALIHSGMQVSITAFLVMLGTLAVSASGRVVYLLPMLIPLAIAATPVVSKIPDGIGRIVDWGARIVFGGLALLCWLIWLKLALTGTPPQWSLLAAHLPMNFQFTVHPFGVAAALLLAAGWLWMAAHLPRLKARAVVSWAGSLILMWGTAFALLLPWIDAAKSYQSTFRDLSAAFPDNMHCLATRGLGESERGMLHYIAGIEPERLEVSPNANCEVLLWQGVSSAAPDGIATEGWQLRWQGARPGEQREHFWVFTRSPRAILADGARAPAQN